MLFTALSLLLLLPLIALSLWKPPTHSMGQRMRAVANAVCAAACLLVAPACVQAGPLDVLGERTANTDPAVVQTEHVRAQLLAYAPQGLQVGEPAWLGLEMAHQDGWHTYWKNPGDSGLPTELEWQVPQGVSVGEIAWPTPEKLRIGQLANYGYEHTVLLPVPLEVSAEWLAQAAQQGQTSLPVELQATWLVCQLECIPESGHFELNVPIFSSSAANAALFNQAFAAQPQQSPALRAQVQATGDGPQAQLSLSIEGLPASLVQQPLELFAEAPYTIRHGAQSGLDWQQQWSDSGTWSAQVPFANDRDASAETLAFVVKPMASSAAGALAPDSASWRVVATVTQPWQAQVHPAAAAHSDTDAALASNTDTGTAAASASSEVVNALAPAASAASAPAQGLAALATTLLLAFLGGALLNLMPCVFPILAIKALSIVKYAPQSDAPSAKASSSNAQAWAYGVGVVVSFFALGALMLVLRSIGTSLGWGFQLQSPWFVAAMAVLFTLIGLSLAGVFSVGAWTPQRLAQANPRSALANAFLSGVLAVLIASPCTGPFMGAALGASLSMPIWAALLVFVALGVGMALPFMALVWFPRLLQRLPKPGQWMATFQKAMSFPMFATVIWLLWVLSFQVGAQAAMAFLLGLWALSFVLWLLVHRPAKTSALALKGIWAVTVVGIVWVLLWSGQHFYTRTLQNDETPAAVSAARADTVNGAVWQPWSGAAVADALARQQPVFVDFTASWCITCQFNKLNALSDAEVLNAFAQHNVLLLRADWTRQNPEISAALKTLGRNGVPTYALYQNGQPALVMTEILDANTLLAAINALP